MEDPPTVISVAILRVRQKVVYMTIARFFEGKESIDQAKAAQRAWVDATLALNRPEAEAAAASEPAVETSGTE